jgi:hypothetical protein
MANIIISEAQEMLLLNTILKEECGFDYGEKRLLIKKHLDNNFMKGSTTEIVNGKPTKIDLVVMLGPDKKPIKSMTDKQLFEYLESEFQNIVPREERTDFIKETMIAWYNNTLSRNGNIV